MKKVWRIVLGINGWEYSRTIDVKAEKVEVLWSSDAAKESRWNGDEDGDVLIADGVRIEFGGEFEFKGEQKAR